MTDLDFQTDELLEQARGNQTAIWHVAARWARERDGSVDGWADFVGRMFAPSWDEMGPEASAREVALQSAFNLASTQDLHPVSLIGDDERSELVVEGPDQATLDSFGTTRQEIDRSNELVFRAIAEGRGLTPDCHRDDRGLHLIFSRSTS